MILWTELAGLTQKTLMAVTIQNGISLLSSTRSRIRSLLTVLITITVIAITGTEAATYYVWTNSPVDGPGTNWATAFHEIQSGVSAATNAIDMVLVTNGIYTTGGATVSDLLLTNRVAVTNPVTVQSVNGRDVTIIMGQGPLGDAAVRCVYLITNAILSGFTLSTGHTRSAGADDDMFGGGAWAQDATINDCILRNNAAYQGCGGAMYGTISNCIIAGNLGGEVAGGVGFCTVYNSIISSNEAGVGGGTYGGHIINCTVSDNMATGYCGGVYYSTMTNCLITRNTAMVSGGGGGGYFYNCTVTCNRAIGQGGGTLGGVVSQCTVSSNIASWGGGTYNGTISNCTIIDNWAASGGGGVAGEEGSVYNSSIAGNTCGEKGGGAYECTLINCTVAGNHSSYIGGGTVDTTNFNCIVYGNSAAEYSNYYDCTFRYSCTAPTPAGTGNISINPLLASLSHLASNSPCIGQGAFGDCVGMDIDGQGWLNPPCMGCDQIVTGTATGILNVSIRMQTNRVARGVGIHFQANIKGIPYKSTWSIAPDIAYTNMQDFSHAWTNTGSYPVILTAYNDTHPSGISDTVTVQVLDQPVYYVAASNATAELPYDSWIKAAANIQDAINACDVYGALVLVSNGVYNRGGTVTPHGSLTNRVVVRDGIILRSINGPDATMIVGLGPLSNASVRGVYMDAGTTLSGFTVSNGHAKFPRIGLDDYRNMDGGGIYGPGATISDCVVVDCSAQINGGGIYQGTVNNCTIAGNIAYDGGGLYGSTIINCTICCNTGNQGGGVMGGVVENSIIYYNTAPFGPNFWSNYTGGAVSYSCADPAPSGTGNISDNPQFVDITTSNFLLRSTSPCFNTGNTAHAPTNTTPYDLAGNKRILFGTVDMGAYERIYLLSANSGPGRGGNSIIVTNGTLGNGDDITNIMFCGIQATITDQGTNWVQATLGACADPYHSVTGDVFIQSASIGDTTFEVAYTYNRSTGLVFYVNASQPDDMDAGTSWNEAKKVIQSAIDLTLVGDTVLVTNGLYNIGGVITPGYALTNRVCITNAITVRSVNGPGATMITGSIGSNGSNDLDSVRGVFMINGAALAGITVSNGSTMATGNEFYDRCGGALWLSTNCTVNNCILRNSAAHDHGGGVLFNGAGTINDSEIKYNQITTGNGGGVFLYGGGIINNGMITYNLVPAGEGGGAYMQSGGALNNCVIYGNNAWWTGGGVYLFQGGDINNSIIWSNMTGDFTSVDIRARNGGMIYYSCAADGITNGLNGCTTNSPLFVNGTNGNYILQPGSPCIDTGNNALPSTGRDFNNVPRPLDGDANGSVIIDMGIYEYVNHLADSDHDTMNDAWEVQHNLNPTNAADALVDDDSDYVLNKNEYGADTDPWNALSVFVVTAFTNTGVQDICFYSSTGRQYALEYTTNGLTGTWTNWPDIAFRYGTGTNDSFTITNIASDAFYRLIVEIP